MLSLLISTLLLRLVAGAPGNVTSSEQCSCGFQDASTHELWTDSIILYFNETGVDANVFQARDYQNQNQKGWNTVFKQGADSSNIQIGNNGSLPWQDATDGTSPSLEMWMDGFEAYPYSHYSKGAELRSIRRDILYGSFRAEMRSAQPWVGGSAMSMYVQYNDSQQIYMDLLNMNSASEARVMQTINGEWPDNKIGVNYTTIQQGNPPKIAPHQPFDFMEVGFNWNESSVSFHIFDNQTRFVSKSDRTLPTTPESLYLSHWSTGDDTYMQGPPMDRSVANVRWIRAFFNSSLMTASDHQTYDKKCAAINPCSVDDMSLRGSTTFSAAAMNPWKPPMPNEHIRTIAGYVAAAFSVFGITSMINALVRRGPWHRFKKIRIPGSKRASTHALRRSLRQSMGANPEHNYPGPPPPFIIEGKSGSGSETPAPGYTSHTGQHSPQHSGTMTPLPAYASRSSSPWQSMYQLVSPKRSMHSGRATPVHSRSVSSQHVARQGSIASLNGHAMVSPTQTTAIHEFPAAEEEANEEDEAAMHEARSRAYRELDGNHKDDDEDDIKPTGTDSSSVSYTESRSSGDKQELHAVVEEKETSFIDYSDEKKLAFEVPPAPQDESVAKELVKPSPVPDAMTGGATAEPATEQKPLAPNQPQQRIDYLAGLTVVSCIFVTLRHFSLTFWPYVTESQGEIMHFPADQVLSYILGPYFLTPLWIGPFFVTSCRFLAQRYLRTGKLNDIANKMCLRAPRMLIPCFVFMALEYFLISLGLTAKLQWLPSVSYSTWPYVIPQPNFGIFLNEMVELAYIIPNAAPEIINHYCVGVLWTIPVQLQYSFVTLAAAVLIKDIKKPWKRFLFYTLTILAGWYASSWSACHWLGLLLADLDITYDWVKWTQARWWALYPILFLSFGVAIATPLTLLFNSDIYYFSFLSWENAIHPDPTTGRPIFQTVESIYEAYPAYYAPTLAILTFSVGLQICVELSTWVQKALSIPLITFFHPHIMTIYLLHGFVFWSLGAYIAVALSSTSLPYWAILLIVAVCCYATIFIFTVILTPLIEFATKGCTKNVWRWATETPVPHRQTTAPFSKQLVLGRQMDESKREGDA